MAYIFWHVSMIGLPSSEKCSGNETQKTIFWEMQNLKKTGNSHQPLTCQYIGQNKGWLYEKPAYSVCPPDWSTGINITDCMRYYNFYGLIINRTLSLYKTVKMFTACVACVTSFSAICWDGKKW